MNITPNNINKIDQAVRLSDAYCQIKGEIHAKKDNLNKRSNMLQEDAIMFNRQSRRLRWRMLINNVKMTALIIFCF